MNGAEEVTHLRKLLTDDRGAIARVAIVLPLANAAQCRTLDEAAKRELRSKYAVDVLFLSWDDVRAIARSADPGRHLRSLLLSKIDLTTVSVFQTNGPTEPGMFFGRERELREIEEHAMTTSYAVVGGRRIGKSSILLRLHLYRLVIKDFKTLYFDCSTVPDLEDFERVPLLDWRPRSPFSGPITFRKLLDTPRTNERLVLLLDEADKLVPRDRASGWPVFNNLRAIIASGRAQVVLGGERVLREAMADPRSPLFNSVNEILLGPLQLHEIEELVTRPLRHIEIELSNSSAVVQRVFEVTCGHPNVAQRLCRRLIERPNIQLTRRITLDDVDTVVNDPRFQEEDFLGTFWEAATPLEKIITLVMVGDRRPLELREVCERLASLASVHASAQETKTALNRLVDLRTILRRSPAGYEFAVTAFPTVLTKTTTIDDQLEVLVEEYQLAEVRT